MGNHKPERKADETKKSDLTGYESAQRKRFLRTEEEESRQNNNAWIQALLPEMILITMSLEVILPSSWVCLAASQATTHLSWSHSDKKSADKSPEMPGLLLTLDG